MEWVIGGVVVVVLGLMTAIRLAPLERETWHVSPQATWGAWNEVVPMTGGASLRLSPEKGRPQELLVRLDKAAMATPRTMRLAGSEEEGRVTWVTRSAFWGFPDVTTAEVREDGLYVLARLRFGREDMGVNAKRLRRWLAAL
ncbi:DUF1499 domain-containing protein [Pseudorhodobacter sp. MZDSW-24AT]|uniref:DUF1499 domain-containing protein n=1 Tax=Pseudorhodobacter sp. MZDSW-24AT TaxID=2052957 RepID=UPI000C1ED5A9|nr:DUF1499 domain-containing protein [Pseudorhodobacter sp. MZDSW-24AT]PJF10981.1 DUF1499 domain-containing protein [Pseudorhodobacter sp. MZDSW-24AT]